MNKYLYLLLLTFIIGGGIAYAGARRANAPGGGGDMIGAEVVSGLRPEAVGDTAGMRQEIMAVLGRQPQAGWAVAFEDLGTGQQFLLNEHDRFHAASTMKTPVLIEAFRLAAEHKLALTDSVLIHTDFMSIADSSRYILDSASDSEKELYGLAGKKLPLRELLYRMITESSNLSTNLVIEAVGAKNVVATMRQLGAMDIQVLRGVEDQKAFDKGMNNTTTAYDLMLIFDRIATGKAVDPAACSDMIGILKAQHFKEIIAGKLPDGVQVASKSGWITGVHHDSGIVYLPDGRRYVLVLLSKDIADDGEAVEIEATVSRIIYDHMTGVRVAGDDQAKVGGGGMPAAAGGGIVAGMGGRMEAAYPVVDKLFKAYAAKNHYPGLVYGIVANGKLVYSGATGYSDLEKKTVATAGSDFRIASMTKSFVSTAILQLRDAGRLRLDDPAYLYIPELKDQRGSASDAPVITIRNLLTHSAGFPEDNPWGDRQLAVTDAELLAMVKKGISFSNSPGIAYEYSNMGFALLGYIIQKVTGERYENYITAHILQPLGMEHTYWEYERVPADRLAHGYRWLNGGWVEQPLLHDGAYGAMGGMITTIEDFTKYEAFQLDAWPSRSGPEPGPLKRSSRREMQQPWMFNNLNTQFSYSGAQLCPMVSSYAYGLRWSKDCKGRTFVGHTGGLPGFGSNWNMLTDYGIGVICMANLTYANAAAINLQVLDTLVTLAGLRPRAVPVSPVLEQRKKELVALLPEWKDAEKSGIFAVNFWLDYFVDSLRSEAGAAFARAGKIVRVGEVVAENGMRGSFLLHGERADIEVRFTLTPENPARVQEYHIRVVER
jgi:CubicO group peptidase (beta-lactamase class C family)/beta-lactamase class A